MFARYIIFKFAKVSLYDTSQKPGIRLLDSIRCAPGDDAYSTSMQASRSVTLIPSTTRLNDQCMMLQICTTDVRQQFAF